MSITKTATSSFPLRLISPENLLTYADQIAVETDADGKMTKSQAQFNAEVLAGGGGGGIALKPGGGLTVEEGGVTLVLGSALYLDSQGKVCINHADDLTFDSDKLTLNLGSGITRDGTGRPTINVGEGLTLGADGKLSLTNSGSGIIIQ